LSTDPTNVYIIDIKSLRAKGIYPIW